MPRRKALQMWGSDCLLTRFLSREENWNVPPKKVKAL